MESVMGVYGMSCDIPRTSMTLSWHCIHHVTFAKSSTDVADMDVMKRLMKGIQDVP